MGATHQSALPEDLQQAQNQFLVWRKQRQPGQRIPLSLWRLAVQLVRSHGLSRTATALGLDYYSLKKQVDTTASQPQPSAPAFVELPATCLVSKQARFELDNGAGASLRVQLVGYDATDIEALTCHFWKTQ